LFVAKIWVLFFSFFAGFFWRGFVSMEGLRGGGHGEAAVDGGDERWVEDSSVDYQGRPPLRAATGSWKAAMFIICKPL
jgi:hypothetical protein